MLSSNNDQKQSTGQAGITIGVALGQNTSPTATKMKSGLTGMNNHNQMVGLSEEKAYPHKKRQSSVKTHIGSHSVV
jgi:hypothetical protein